jgi:recombination protein U
MVKYPNGITKKTIKNTNKTFANRGMNFEALINQSNCYYLDLDIANIHKKPTPITIVNVDYPSRNKAKITEAYFKTPSTTDYNGVYKGRAIDFEAKDCNSKTSFPLKSIHQHQIKHLESVLHHGAIAFILLRFNKLDEIYYIEASKVINYYYNPDKKSLSYKWVTENGYLLPLTYNPPIKYLKIIDQLYFKEEL